MSGSDAKVRLAAVAARQWGRVTWSQLRVLADDRTLQRWIDSGYLHRVLPGVYAVGHAAPDRDADLAAALLYAGPGAMLSHATGAWWHGLLKDRPSTITISTPRRRRSRRGIKIHERRTCERVWRAGMPVTTVAQALLDLAADVPLRMLRKALAEADYRRMLNVAEVEAMLGRGRAGSEKLRAAIRRHQPRLARTKSDLEVMFLEICEAAGIPPPETNERVAGWEVDALWREHRIAIELDGYGNHRTRAQVERDRRKDLELRAAGWRPVRYTHEQLENTRTAVVEDVRRLRALSLPELLAGPGSR